MVIVHITMVSQFTCVFCLLLFHKKTFQYEWNDVFMSRMTFLSPTIIVKELISKLRI